MRAPLPSPLPPGRPLAQMPAQKRARLTRLLASPWRVSRPAAGLALALAALASLAGGCGGDAASPGQGPGHGSGDATTQGDHGLAPDSAQADVDAGPAACPVDYVACDDGNPCTENDFCLDGECRGALASCDDGDPCTDDSCQAEAGCVHEPNAAPCDDGNPCTSMDTCAAGACQGQPVSGLACDDGDPCTLADSCQQGVCGGKRNLCNDLNPCTEDACDPTDAAAEPGTFCVHKPLAGSCDDVNPCTKEDTCKEGVCAGTPTPGMGCSDGDLCTLGDTCQGDGSCAGTAADCDDANPCTIDSCDTTGGCVHEPDEGLACDDGDKCTVGDACDATGACVGGPKCVPADACEEMACVVETGACVPSAVVCDDGNPCTDDACDPTEGCQFAPNTASCNDGDACTTGDVCAGGACGGQATVCDASGDTTCAVNTCDPETGACALKDMNGVPCDDGDPCTSPDNCSGGVCKGVPKTCTDDDPCTDDFCEADTGACQHVTPVGGCADIGLSRSNEYRQLMSLPLLANSDVIITAATNHCEYFVNHQDDVYAQGLSPHNEAQGYEGFTGQSFADRMTSAGWQTTMGYPAFEVMAFLNDPKGAVDAWVATLYHRLPFLLPQVATMGYGAAQHAMTKCDTIDFASSPDSHPEYEGTIVVFPVDGMTGVPTSWDGMESPTPPLPAGEAYPSGPILTVSFGAASGYAGASIQDSWIMDPDGSLVSHVALQAAKPGAQTDVNEGVDADLCCGVLALYPVAPLQPLSTYTVHVDYSVNGSAGNVEWSFTTNDGGSLDFLP